MSIQQFIQQDIFLPRLQSSGVLVIYDPARRYRDLCLALDAPTLRVVDASDSSIESREQALATLQELGQPRGTLEGMLLYVPAPPPVTEEECQRDPFAIYGALGRTFPEGDGDEYLALCLRARPDHATEIRRIFQDDPSPAFAVIDAIGAGGGWPQLQAALGAASARSLLFALLTPSDAQKKSLSGDGWRTEANALLDTTLNLKLTTRARSWAPVGDELWRFLLFSEFVFDLPGELPPALADVPRAPEAARPLVYDLCERLRNDLRTQPLYLERADTIERDLALKSHCADITDLGTRDTFPFEERTLLARAIAALRAAEIDTLRTAIARHQHSLWSRHGENQAQWSLVTAAARLVEAAADAERELSAHTTSQGALLDHYLHQLHEVDRLHREFEQATADLFEQDSGIRAVVASTRQRYRQLATTLQAHFVRHLERSGWPPVGYPASIDLFERRVAPLLQTSGQRVALFLIDALRYELGVELYQLLQAEGQGTLEAACAALPTVTPIGMASLLPGAGQHLRLVRKGNDLLPHLGDQPVATLSQRLDLLRRRYGERFEARPLTTLLQQDAPPPSSVELLVIRSNEMDSDFESNPDAAPGLISRTFRQLLAAVRRLREWGFDEVVILADHGFYLNSGAGAGDVASKPPGTWHPFHDRLLLGDGQGDASNAIFPATHLGIRGDVAQAVLPRGMVPYRAGLGYFHGGASLQESIVPVITLRLPAPVSFEARPPQLTLRYKRGAKRITTRRPVLDLEVGTGELFAHNQPITLIVEAQDSTGRVVGEAISTPGGPINQATRTLSLQPSQSAQVTLKMELDFEGKFTVKALDPATQTILASLALETDYTV